MEDTVHESNPRNSESFLFLSSILKSKTWINIFLFIPFKLYWFIFKVIFELEFDFDWMV